MHGSVEKPLGAIATNRPVVIVSTLLPRWIADFGALTEKLAAAGLRVTLFAPRPDPEAATGWRSDETIREARDQLPDQVDLRFLPGSSTHEIGPLSALKIQIACLKIALQKRKPLVFLWNPYPIVMFGPLLRAFGVPVVFMVTGLGWNFSDEGRSNVKSRIIRAVYRLVFRGERYRVLVHNKDDKAALVREFGIRADLIHVTPGCGVDPADFPFAEDIAPTRTPIVLVPVRLLKQKGVLDAAEASRQLAERGVDHEMWFTSNHDPTHPSALSLEDIAETERRCPNVRFKGFHQSLVPLYAKASVVCVPTYYQEGLPTALLEAASMGRPIVTCDNWGGRDFIRDGVDGLLVPPRSPGALADSLETLLKDQALADQFRRSAFQRFLDGFTKQHMVEISLDACAELTGERL